MAWGLNEEEGEQEDPEHTHFVLRWRECLAWCAEYWDDDHVLAQFMERLFALQRCPRATLDLTVWHPQLSVAHTLFHQLVNNRFYLATYECQVTLGVWTERDRMERYIRRYPVCLHVVEHFVMQQGIRSNTPQVREATAELLKKGVSLHFRHGTPPLHTPQNRASETRRAWTSSISHPRSVDRRVYRRTGFSAHADDETLSARIRQKPRTEHEQMSTVQQPTRQRVSAASLVGPLETGRR